MCNIFRLLENYKKSLNVGRNINYMKQENDKKLDFALFYRKWKSIYLVASRI